MSPHLSEASEGLLGHRVAATSSPRGNEAIVGLIGRWGFTGGRARQTEIPLTGVRVDAEVNDFIAEVKISQCYQNTEKVPLEATYYFPVDVAAAVCGFEARYEDGSVVKGVAREKEQTRRDYSQAMQEGKQAHMLENVRRDAFALKVGNLPPGECVRIVLTYVTTLKAQGDAAAFVLPTCIAPRYSPSGSAHTVSWEEAAALQPPTTSVKLFGLTIKVNFNCRSNIKDIFTPTHPEYALSSQIEGKFGTASLKNVSMDRELVLLVEEEEAHQPRACVEISDDGSVAGVVTLFPRLEFWDLRREIIYLVDRSGSMGWTRTAGKSQIEQAGEALLFFLRSLPPDCMFNIVGFGSTFEPLFPTPMPFNDDTLKTATRYAMSMSANMGGTEINVPLESILGRDPASGLDRQVFVLTDGQVSNDLEVFETIRRGCAARNNGKWWRRGAGSGGRCRLFSLGIGAGASRHLVEGMARAGKGTARFIQGGDPNLLRATIMEQLKQALQPALDNVSVTWNMPEIEVEYAAEEQPVKTPVKTLLGYRSPSADKAPGPPPLARTFPSVVPPVFNTERFLSFAMFPPNATNVPDSVTVKCETPDGPLEETIDITDEEIFQGAVAHRMAARAAISEYEDARKFRPSRPFSIGSSPPCSVISGREALKLALDNSLASEATSFVAVLETTVVNPGGSCVSRVIPQHLPMVDSPPPRRPPSGIPPPPAGSLTQAPRPGGKPSESHFTATGTIGSSTTELGDVFQNLAEMVSSQRDIACRIEDDIVCCACTAPLSLKDYMGSGRGLPSRCLTSLTGAIGRWNGTIQHRISLVHAVIAASLLICLLSWYQVLSWGAVTSQSLRSVFPLSRMLWTVCALLCVRTVVSTQLSRERRTSGSIKPAAGGSEPKKMSSPTRKARASAPSTEKANASTSLLQMAASSGEPKKPGAPTHTVWTSATSSKIGDSDDILLRLSLLQNADGSFALDSRLSDVAGVSLCMAKCAAAKAFGRKTLDDAQVASALAVAVLRTKFAEERNIWELQEGKAIKYLCSGERSLGEVERWIDVLSNELRTERN